MAEGGTWTGVSKPPTWIVNRLKRDPKNQHVKFQTQLTRRALQIKAPIMDTLPLNYTKWSDRLAFDIALLLEGSGESLDEVVERHKITTSDIITFNKDPVFLRKVEHYRGEIRDKGLTFRMKARAQSEELLKTSWLLIHSPDVSAAVKADLIKSTVKWAGLEPKNEVSQEGTGGVRITINLGNQEHTAKVIEHEPEYAEIE